MHSELDARSGGGDCESVLASQDKTMMSKNYLLSPRCFFLPSQGKSQVKRQSQHPLRPASVSPTGADHDSTGFLHKGSWNPGSQRTPKFQASSSGPVSRRGSQEKELGVVLRSPGKGRSPAEARKLGGFLSADFLPLEILFLRRLCSGRLDHRILYFLCARH